MAFCGDLAFAVLSLTGTYATGDAVDVLLVVRNLLPALVVLLPGAAQLTASTEARKRRSPQLGALLLVAGLIGPSTVLLQLLTARSAGVVGTAAATLLLTCLVLARLRLLLRAQA